jgi:DNA polymerase-3 subunit epsilon
MRHIVLDTETTGLDPKGGHRIIEIGCVELINHIPSGKVFHHYLNPERDVPKEAENIHGISTEMLQGKPLFADVASDFVDFIGDAPLVIHNAAFDMGFLNMELQRFGLPALDHARAIDTVILARRKFPGAPASLDALCKRFSIDTSARNFHGALLDARLLADVYLELSGGRQADLSISFVAKKTVTVTTGIRVERPVRVFEANADELAAHAAAMQKVANNLWSDDSKQ